MKLLVASPAYDGVKNNFFHSALALKNALNKEGIPATFITAPGMPVDAARDVIANGFRRMRAAYDRLLMIDNDMGYQPGTVLEMLASDHDFCVAAPPLRRTRVDLALEAAASGRSDPARFASEFAMEPLAGDRERKAVTLVGGFQQVEHAGSAFMLLSQKVFDAIADANPKLGYRAADGALEHTFFHRRLVEGYPGGPRGEDVSFSRYWRDAGGQIWLLVDAALTHEGPCTFSGNYAKITGLAD